MAAVLGVSAHYHDAAAALVIDGQLVCAIQEERLSRHKHDPSLPTRAIAACLKQASLARGALDAVVFYEDPFAKLERVLSECIRQFPAGARMFPRAMASQLGDKLWVLDQLAAVTGVARQRVSHVPHHESHAASAYYAAGFDDAAVLTVDGVGERVTTAIWHGQGGTLRCKLTQELPDSIGLVYAALTAWLGFHVNSDEYKVMGLAAYGQPVHRDLIERLLRPEADGAYRVDPRWFAGFLDPDRAYGPKLLSLLGPARAPGQAWRFDDAQDQRYADIAASLQAVVEDVLLGLARRARRDTNAAALCLAGGVALNAKANARIASEAGFERVYVQPAAGDAGGALGAAWLAAVGHGDAPQPLTRLDWGCDAQAAQTHDVARAAGLTVSRVGDPARRIATSLQQGAVVGLVSGRFEWGPRALGQRSILAAPGPAAMRDQVNARVKGRELFRPLAPSVRSEEMGALFDAPADALTPWMTSLRKVRPEHREALAAVMHVDASSRPQSVASDGPALLREVLDHQARDTGLGAVLNTSLNLAGEPLVASGIDALDVLMRSQLDALLVEDLWIERPSSRAQSAQHAQARRP